MSILSGKFVLRLDPKLHKLIQEAAERRGISLNQFCVSQLEASLGQSRPAETYLAFGLPIVKLRKGLEDANISSLGCLLFGSISRGEASQSSDLDLLVVLPQDTELDRDLYSSWDFKIQPLLKDVPREVTPQFVTLPSDIEQAGGLWFEVALEGVLLWEKGTSLSQFLVSLREAMARGEIVRKVSYGHPFWIRKDSA